MEAAPSLSAPTRDEREAQVVKVWKKRKAGLFIVDPTRLNEHSKNAAYGAPQWNLVFGQDHTEGLIFEARITKLGKPNRLDKPPPEAWCPAFRRFAWLMINEPLPDLWTSLGRPAGERPGADAIGSAFASTRAFITWLNARPGREDIAEFRDVTDELLTDYVRHLQRHPITSGKKMERLTGLSYLWAYGAAGYLPDSDILPTPRWIESRSKLFGSSDRGEGVAPLEQSSIDPAVTWAQEFVDSFANDCLNALAWYAGEIVRVRAREPSHQAGWRISPEVEQAVAVIRSMKTVPSSRHRSHPHVAVTYLAAAHPPLTKSHVKAAVAWLRRRGELPPLSPMGVPKPKPKPVPEHGTAPDSGPDRPLLPRWDVSPAVQQAISVIRSMEMLPRDRVNGPGIAYNYLAATNPPLTIKSAMAAVRWLKRRGGLPPLAPLGTPQPIPVPVYAKINGAPWIDFEWQDVVPVSERTRIGSVLQGACTILMGYFGAGPRPLELRSLKKGCMRVEDRGNGSIRWHIHGRITKGERNESGHKDHVGREHVWPSLPQAARAAGLMERLPSNAPNAVGLFTNLNGESLTQVAMQASIDDFVSKANRLVKAHSLSARRNIHHEADRITVSRLRRTIDTHIYSRPDGSFDLAVVNGHRNLETTAIYGGLKQSGHGGHISPALAETVASTLSSLGTVLDAGGGVSGPSAKDVIEAAATFKGSIDSTRNMKKALDNPNIRAFDNPDGAIGCKPRPGYAMPCQNDALEDRKTDPDPTSCKRGCSYIYRTDAHAITLESRAEEVDELILLEQQDQALADLAPGPEEARLRAKAEHWRREAEEHWSTRIGKDGAMLDQIERGERQ